MEPTSPSGLPSTSSPSAPQKTPGLAVASFVLGIISLVGASVLLIPTILAIVFGHISYSRIKKDPGLTGSGFAIAGFVMGYVSIVVGLFFAGLMAAMAIPAFQKVRDNAMKNAMINDARQIGSAAAQIMLENGDKPVRFEINPVNGEVSGPISAYVKTVSKGTRQVDGLIENEKGTFSLQNPQTNRGRPIVFDAEGREVP